MAKKTKYTLDNPKGQKPLIGVALGGGVARGISHIGVLRELDDMGLTIDIIAGTSIGAVAGACYLNGSLDAFEEWAMKQTARNFWSSADFILNGSGLIGGKKFEKLLRREVGNKTMEDWNGKFTVVSTELNTGHEVWLRRGDIVTAVMASYALPGILPAVNIDGRWLLDGALVNPLPVSVCRAMGARLVIANNLNNSAFEIEMIKNELISEKKPKNMLLQSIFENNDSDADKKPGIVETMSAAFNILMDRITRARIAGDPADILLTPKVGQYSLFAFHKAEELIELGRQEVRKNKDDILYVLDKLS